MVLEINSVLYFDPLVSVLNSKDELIQIVDFCKAFVEGKQPNYIMGDSMKVDKAVLSFSQRYPSETQRKEIINFIELIKGYTTAGKVTIHDCFHDTNEGCKNLQTLMEWGGINE